MGLAILIAVAGVATITALMACVFILVAAGLNENDFMQEIDA